MLAPSTLHTPYDGSSEPFRIGLKPLDPAEWIEPDDRLPAYLDEKQRLAAERFSDIFAAEPGTEAAQAELLDLLAQHLPARFPEIYQREADVINIRSAGRQVSLTDRGTPPLWIAAQLVQEDLVLMRRGEDGWRLAAAALSFPSSWSLKQKFGRPMHEVHRPVPGFGPGTRHADLIGRMFDKMRPEMPMIRWNWSIYSDAELFHPESANPSIRRFGTGAAAENVFIRVERQTLRRLPVHGDIVFTIRIHHDPVERLEQHADGASRAAGLAAQLRGLDAEQLDYKGLTADRDRLLGRLMSIEHRGAATGGRED